MKWKTVAALLVIAALACGGAESPLTPPADASIRDHAVIPEIGGRTAAELVWEGGLGATSFQIEAGSAPGGMDVATVDAGAPAIPLVWRGAPAGVFYMRLRGRNAAGLGGSYNEVSVVSVDPYDIVEALFLDSGPFAFQPSLTAGSGAMVGWEPGTTIAILASSNVPQDQRNAIRKTSAQLVDATAGRLRAQLADIDDPDPEPAPGQIVISSGDELVRKHCRADIAGCFIGTYAGSVISAGRIVTRGEGIDGQTMAHELGHALLGLRHFSAPEGMRLTPVMTTKGIRSQSLFYPADQWDPVTLRASVAVYGAGLSAGARRAEFISAGLIHPRPPATSSASEGALGAGMNSLDGPTGETVIIKEFCKGPAVPCNGVGMGTVTPGPSRIPQ